MQLEELTESELTDINEESGCNKKDEDDPEEICITSYTTRKQAQLKPLLVSFLIKIQNTLILNVSNVLNDSEINISFTIFTSLYICNW